MRSFSIKTVDYRSLLGIYYIRYTDRTDPYIQLLGEKRNETLLSNDEINLLQVISNQFVTALTTARFYVEAVEKRRIEHELIMAQKIQAKLLPEKLPNNGCYSLAPTVLENLPF